jgi:hypothetical protein
MYLRLMPNLLHFLPDLNALYSLRHAPNFYEIHPWLCIKHRVARILMESFVAEKKLLFNMLYYIHILKCQQPII